MNRPEGDGRRAGDSSEASVPDPALTRGMLGWGEAVGLKLGAAEVRGLRR